MFGVKRYTSDNFGHLTTFGRELRSRQLPEPARSRQMCTKFARALGTHLTSLSASRELTAAGEHERNEAARLEKV